MSFEMATHQRTLALVFSNLYEFEIPSYQRPYEWGPEQAEKLLDDLEKGERTGMGCFLGALVLVKGGDQFPKASVIDGQQRLTTLTILLATLRDMADDMEFGGALNGYVVQPADRILKQSAKPRLLLRPSDREFFRAYVQTAGGTLDLSPETVTANGSQSNFLAVALTIRSRLGAMTDDRRSALASFLLTECFLVIISVAEQKSARLIFTVLNSRGVDLSPVDILKASFLEGTEGEVADDYARRWEGIEDRLGRPEFKRLFPLILAARGNDVAEDAIEEDFPVMEPSFAQHEEFLAVVLSPAASFLSLALPGHGPDARLRLGAEGAMHLRSLTRLRRFDRGWEEVALARFLGIGTNEWNTQAAFLARLERLAYFMAVTGVAPKARLERYRTVRSQVLEGGDIPELTTVERADFAKGLGRPIYGREFCLPVMQKLEDVMSTIGIQGYGDPQTIEHVLPQNPRPESRWLTAFPDAIQRPTQANLIGNLVFLTREANVRASNADFEVKKNEYVHDEHGVQNYALTMDLFRNDVWNAATLKARQERVIERLSRAWGLVAEPAPDVIRAEQARFVLAAGNAETDRAFERDGQFVVLRGASCAPSKAPSKLRKDLVASGVIGPDADGREAVFQQHWAFKTAAAAATVLLGKTARAKTAWKEIGSGRTYGEVEEAAEAAAAA